VTLKLPKHVLRKFCQGDNLLSDSDYGDSLSKCESEKLPKDPNIAPRSMKEMVEDEAQETYASQKSFSSEISQDRQLSEVNGGCVSSNETKDVQDSAHKITQMLPDKDVIEKSQLTIVVTETAEMADFESEEFDDYRSAFRTLHSRIHPELRYTDYNCSYNLPPHHVTAISTWQKGCIYEKLMRTKKSATYTDIQVASEAIPYGNFEATDPDGEVMILDPIVPDTSPPTYKTLDSMLKEANRLMLRENNGTCNPSDDSKVDVSPVIILVSMTR